MKPIQIFYRIYYKIRKKPVIYNPPSISERERQAQVVFWIKKPNGILGNGSFKFLNHERNLNLPEDWNNISFPVLWTYNLHYFDGIIGCLLDKNEVFEYLEKWIVENPIGSGFGWDPYPTSLRIVNWIKYITQSQTSNTKVLRSLYTQVLWLEQHIEYHILGNHLFANFKALYFAGHFFNGNDSDRWYLKGLDGLSAQTKEQILSDGAHFERSTMYHSLILEDILDCISISKMYGFDYPEKWNGVVNSMLKWAKMMTHPDGELSFFNDAALGIAPNLDQLTNYSALLAIPSSARLNVVRGNSGFRRLQSGHAVVICDVGDVGPRYQPGHAHANTLSFELSVGPDRLVVNSGVSEYGISKERDRQRGTIAHSTLCIDDSDSSEVWHAFRVGRRARIQNICAIDLDNTFILSAEHTGYNRLTGSPIHRRTWKLLQDGLHVYDNVKGHGSHQIDIYFHFHPSVFVEKQGSILALRTPSGIALTIEGLNSSFEIIDTTYHPEFGKTIGNKTLKLHAHSRLPYNSHIHFSWSAT